MRRRHNPRAKRSGPALAPPSRDWHGAWRYFVLIVAGAAVYVTSLGAPKVLDDFVSIDGNPQIRSLLDFAVLMPERELPIAGRPLVNLTLAINYAVDGTDVTGYRAVNLVIHLLCALMVFVVVRRILMLPSVRERWGSGAQDVAFAAALVWLLHPLNSEVVNYVTQRTESMMALCYLVTMYASTRALDALGGRWAAAAVIACGLGVLCKESMATAPVMVALFDRVFVFGSWREAWSRRRMLYAGLAASWLPLAAILATGPRAYSTGFDEGVSVWTYLLNQSVMIARYLRLAVWPDSLVVYYGFPLPLTLPDVLPQALLIVTLLGLTAAAFRYRLWLGFVGAWFFITLAPTSSIVPITTEVGAERRMYLPLLALVVPLCVAAARLPLSRRVLAAGLAVVAIALGTTTFARNREYASALSLAQVTLDRWPTPVAHHMVGEQLWFAGRDGEAEPHLRQATAGAPRAHYTLGMLLYRRGALDAAVAELQAFIRREPRLLEVPEAHFMTASAHAARERWVEAEAEARLAIAKAPRHASARRLLADVLLRSERPSEAAQAYADYVRMRPDDVDAWTNLGIVLASQGRLQDAVVAFRRSVDLAPNDGQVRRNLATVLLDAGQPGEAENEARRAVALRPNDPVAHDLLEQALARQGRTGTPAGTPSDGVRPGP